jgi:hypothetical protein
MKAWPFTQVDESKGTACNITFPLEMRRVVRFAATAEFCEKCDISETA